MKTQKSVAKVAVQGLGNSCGFQNIIEEEIKSDRRS
jgi:hypothetical protein